MKKFLSIALALLMLAVMLPVTAMADESRGSIQGAIINHDAVSVELQDVTFTKSVAVKLYSGDTLLTTATLQPGILNAGQNYPFVTCCIPTKGEDEAWALTPWTPKDNIVPNKAVLFVDDNEKDTKELNLDAAEWAALPGTALPSSGSIERAVITHDNRVLKNAVSVDLKNVNFESSVQVQLYSGETLLTTATLQRLDPGSYGFLTCCIATETADEYWPLTPWTPKDDVVPNRAVLVVDGSKLAEKTFELNADEWAALPGTALPSTIVIITPSADTPKTDNQKNPSTGANDVVAVAAALMAVSALGAVVLTRKK
jgi:hypothetical protein